MARRIINPNVARRLVLLLLLLGAGTVLWRIDGFLLILKAVWIGLAIRGLIISYRAYRLAAGDVAFQQATGQNGPIEMVTQQRLTARRYQMVLFGMYLAVGLLSVVAPRRGPALDEPWEVALAWVATITIPALLLAVAWVNMHLVAQAERGQARLVRAMAALETRTTPDTRPGGRRWTDPPAEGREE